MFGFFYMYLINVKIVQMSIVNVIEINDSVSHKQYLDFVNGLILLQK